MSQEVEYKDIDIDDDLAPLDTSKKLPQKTGNIFSWIFGFLFLFGSFGMLLSGDPLLSTISHFTIGCLLFPPIRKQVHQRTEKSLTLGVRAVLIIALLLISASQVPMDYQP